MEVITSGPSGRRSIHREVGSGGSFGNNPSRLEIGLGKVDKIEAVRVFWPVSKKLIELDGMKKDKHYLIRESNATFEELPFRRIERNLSEMTHNHHHH